MGLAERTECSAADFFATVPAGADAYVLSRILHDWNDVDAERILSRCRDAMRPTSRLLIVEAILPERARDRPAAIRMDIHMMLLLGARERTEAEFETLLERAGFRMQRADPDPFAGRPRRDRSNAGLSVLNGTEPQHETRRSVCLIGSHGPNEADTSAVVADLSA